MTTDINKKPVSRLVFEKQKAEQEIQKTKMPMHKTFASILSQQQSNFISQKKFVFAKVTYKSFL